MMPFSLSPLFISATLSAAAAVSPYYTVTFGRRGWAVLQGIRFVDSNNRVYVCAY